MSEAKQLYREAFEEFAKQNYSEAIAGYRRVVEVDPDFVLAYQAMAEAYARGENLDEAIAAILKAIEIDPDEPLFHTSLSRFLQQQGRIQEAEDEAAIATRLQSKGPIL